MKLIPLRLAICFVQLKSILVRFPSCSLSARAARRELGVLCAFLVSSVSAISKVTFLAPVDKMTSPADIFPGARGWRKVGGQGPDVKRASRMLTPQMVGITLAQLGCEGLSAVSNYFL